MNSTPSPERPAFCLNPPGPLSLLGRGSRLALNGGRLLEERRGDQVSIWLQPDSGERVLTMWPGEYRARLAPLELLDEHAAVVRREAARPSMSSAGSSPTPIHGAPAEDPSSSSPGLGTVASLEIPRHPSVLRGRCRLLAQLLACAATPHYSGADARGPASPRVCRSPLL